MNLPHELYKEIVAHALECAPEECCGLIAGILGSPLVTYRATNVAGDPHHSYEMDPEEQLVFFNNIDAKQFELCAIYHSHPNSEPVPSSTDADLAYYHDKVYLIVGLAGLNPDVRAWRFTDREYTAEPLEITI